MAQKYEYRVSLAEDAKLQLESPSGDTLPVERTKKPAKKNQHTMRDSVILLPIDETIKNMTHGTFEYSQSSKQEASPSRLNILSDRIVESLDRRRREIKGSQIIEQYYIKKGKLPYADKYAKDRRRKQAINRFAASVAAPVFAFDMATKIPRPIDPRELEKEQKRHTLTLPEAVIPESKDLAVEMPNTILTTVGNKQEPSPALPVVESSTRNEAEAQQNQIPTSEQAPPAEQEQRTGEDAAIARVQAEVVALTDEKVQEINAAESTTDAVFTKGMADIAVQSRIAHEVILPYSAEGITQLETMRSDALAALQQALDARNQGAQPTATPSQELAQSGAQAELAPALVSTSEQAPQPTGFEAQVSELTDRTAKEIMASGSAMDAIRMKGEAASAVLSMTAHELMQPYLSHEDAAQLKDMRDQALAALQAGLDVRLESPDSVIANPETESQDHIKAALIAARNSVIHNIVHAETNDDAKVISDQAYNDIFAMPGDDETRIAMLDAIVTTYAKRVASPEIYEFVRQSARGGFVQNESALVEVPKAESVDSQSDESSHEQNSSVDRTVAIEAAKAVEKKKEGRLARMQRVAQDMGKKATNGHTFTKASNDEAQEQPAAVDTETQATRPHETPAGDTEEDPFALARAAGVLRGNSDPGEPVVTSYDEATHRGEGQPEAKLAEVINFPAGAEQPPADDEAPTEELETVAKAINTQEDAPLSRDKMRQMEQIARSKIQLGEYDLWAEMTKADANNEEVDIDGLIKNTRTAIQENVRGWLQEEGRQHRASGLYLSTLEARTMESADSALESIKQAYIKAKQARESRQDSAA